MISRREWLSACRLARDGGRIRPTLANLAAAWREIAGRAVFPPDPFAE